MTPNFEKLYERDVHLERDDHGNYRDETGEVYSDFNADTAYWIEGDACHTVEEE